MASNTPALVPVTSQGWKAGLRVLLGREASQWIRTRYGLIHLIMWIFIINGLMGIIISTAGEELEAGETVVGASIEPFVGITGWFTAIGIAVVAMGTIVGEKKSGTAAWVLSAPVSRSAFLISKLVATGVGGVTTMILIPGLIAFLEFSFIPAAAESGEVSILPWLGALGVMSLLVLFYLALTIFLGTVASSRGAVVGVPIGVFFAGLFVGGALPVWLANLTPWALATPLAMELADDTTAVTSIVPIIATLFWITLLTAGAIWRFQREEF